MCRSQSARGKLGLIHVPLPSSSLRPILVVSSDGRGHEESSTERRERNLSPESHRRTRILQSANKILLFAIFKNYILLVFFSSLWGILRIDGLGKQGRSMLRSTKAESRPTDYLRENGANWTSFKWLIGLTERLQINSKLLAFLIEVAALQAHRARNVRHVKIMAFDFSSGQHFFFKRFCALGKCLPIPRHRHWM